MLKSFTNFYMQVDVLIIDDIQFLAGKDRTQEMFFSHIQSSASEQEANHHDF